MSLRKSETSSRNRQCSSCLGLVAGKRKPVLLAVQGKARLSAAKEGVGIFHTLTEASRSLSPLSSWHQ